MLLANELLQTHTHNVIAFAWNILLQVRPKTQRLLFQKCCLGGPV